METEVRRLPKKTVIFLSILVVLGIFSFFVVLYGKDAKVTKILYQLGYKSVASVHIYATQEFLNEDTNIKGMQYKIGFIDRIKNQECKGFILKDYRGNVDKSLQCIDIKR